MNEPLPPPDENDEIPPDEETTEMRLLNRLFTHERKRERVRIKPSTVASDHVRTRRSAFPFHIQHGNNLTFIETLLRATKETNIERVAGCVSLSATTLRVIMLPFLRQMGLLEGGSLSQLTPWGEALRATWRQAPRLLGEALHIHLYTLHWFRPEVRFSWAYAEIVNFLWANGPCVVDAPMKAQLVGMVVEEAARTFHIPVEEIAFSADSVRGALKWLEGLAPPSFVQARNLFQCRLRYPPTTLLWAVDALYRRAGIAPGERIPLTTDRRQDLCRLCVLQSGALEGAWTSAKNLFDNVLGKKFDWGVEREQSMWV